jgi:predicted nucleic acid-binding protein
VVDSSTWIEIFRRTPLAQMLVQEIPQRDFCVVPTIVQLELTKWLTREAGREQADHFLAFSMKCRVVALDTRIALHAAELCRAHRLPTANAVIYATALNQNAELLTCDAHFDGLPGVIYVPNAA